MADIQYRLFKEISLEDPFFDSLREDYQKFKDWFQKKSLQNEKAYVYYCEGGKLCCFLYLKEENLVNDEMIIPPLGTTKKWLKVGTFKVDAHQTKLGERMVKRIFDFAVEKNIFNIYITIYSRHKALIALLVRYGFYEHGKKGSEMVLTKTIPTKREELHGDMCHDFPGILSSGAKKFILGIHPEYHSKLFSDSKLKTEESNILEDCTQSNSIHKIYLTDMNGVENLKRGDILIIYRTKDKKAENANYSSVATSLCVVEEYRDMEKFLDQDSFLRYCEKHTIFSKEQLIDYYSNKRFKKIIKMTYNVSFKKRVVLKTLREILCYEPYWGFSELSDEHFKKILEAANINESIIIN